MSQTASIELRLPGRPDSVAHARDALDALADHFSSDLLEDLRLLMSEVVTNAVRHARLADDDRLLVRIRETRGRVRVEVCDPGPGFRGPVTAPERGRAGDWGLWLVQELADAWGIRGGGGTCVWFEVACR